MIQIKGTQLIGKTESAEGKNTFKSFNPIENTEFGPEFHEVTSQEISEAVQLAEKAFLLYRKFSEKKRADFLLEITNILEENSTELIPLCMKESALPKARLEGELMRTTNQIRMFAEYIQQKEWNEYSLDETEPNRQPAPKPKLERKLIALGPVAVFGASNFPLAFSVAGGDTASALAAGCSVVVKANPAHPGTSEFVSRCILQAIENTNMPDGVFSLIQGQSHETGTNLVTHPGIQAVGFTGSQKGGTALFKAGMNREVPIPVFAEMGSTNTIFILPEIIQQNTKELTEGIYNSVTLGTGQFCTNPGLIFISKKGAYEDFLNALNTEFSKPYSSTMLTPNICKNYVEKSENLVTVKGVRSLQTRFNENNTAA